MHLTDTQREEGIRQGECKSWRCSQFQRHQKWRGRLYLLPIPTTAKKRGRLYLLPISTTAKRHGRLYLLLIPTTAKRHGRLYLLPDPCVCVWCVSVSMCFIRFTADGIVFWAGGFFWPSQQGWLSPCYVVPPPPSLHTQSIADRSSHTLYIYNPGYKASFRH